MFDKRSVDVVKVEERTDGSATVEFDFTPEEVNALFRAGVIEALQRGIDSARQYDPTIPPRKQTFTLVDEQLDDIIVEELKRVYTDNVDQTPKFADAAKTLLSYFLSSSDFNRWVDEST
jgi:hypothetical protein